MGKLLEGLEKQIVLGEEVFDLDSKSIIDEKYIIKNKPNKFNYDFVRKKIKWKKENLLRDVNYRWYNLWKTCP